MLLLPPFCPACINHWQVPSPSCLPSPPSPFWWRHHRIALALPVEGWHHAIIPSPLPFRHHFYIRTAATATTAPNAYLLAIAVDVHSLALDMSSLSILANADANAVVVGILPDGYQRTNSLTQIPTKQSVPTSREVLPGYFGLPIRIPTLRSLIGPAIGKAWIPWLSCH